MRRGSGPGRGALEPLGLVLSRDAALRVPASIETSPIAARDWEAAVGSRIAARARPVRIDRGVLVVRTATATWAQELSLLSDAILSGLRARGIAVDALRFRVGHVEAPERPPSRSEVRVSPPEVPLPPSVLAVVERVGDPELRDAIAHAAARNLGWQAMNAASPPPPATLAATSAPSVARGPRSAGRESAPPARRSGPSPAARRGKP
jgi:hypothetical protein